MAGASQVGDGLLPLKITRQIDALCDEFESSLRDGGGVLFKPYLDRLAPAGHGALVRELFFLALEALRERGTPDALSEVCRVNAEVRPILESLLNDDDRAAATTIHEGPASRGKSSGLAVRCPHCHSAIELIVDASLVDIDCSNCGGRFSLVNEAEDTRDARTFSKVAHFELVERLGMGEFGTVWKARDTLLDRTVALKIPRREHLDGATIEKFMREARAAAQLRHPNIVSTHEVGRHGDTLYIVIDYIRGVSLADMISDHRLGVRESAVIAAKMAEALEHAHRSGVIHRDLKPSNILIDDYGEPHLMDFGLAKRKETEITMTTDGVIVGTPAYMSPEQARGESAHVDGRSDVYSLGVILFQLLTGELPFRGSMRMLLYKVMHDDPPGPRSLDSHVPKDLDTICLKCLEKEPSRRYPTAKDLADDLGRFLRGEPVAARRLGRIGRTWRWMKRNRVVTSLLAATMIVLCGATAVSSYQAHLAKSALYDSVMQEIRLTRELRSQGYGETVGELVSQAQQLKGDHADKDELRRQVAQTMGDFVAYPPSVIVPSGARVTTIEFSRDDKQLLAGTEAGGILVYDVRSGHKAAELAGHNGRVHSLAMSDDGGTLASADGRGSVRVWRRDGGTWKFERSFETGAGPYCVFLSDDGERAAWLKGSELEVWDVRGGKKLRSLPTESGWEMRNGAFDFKTGRLIAGYLNAKDDRVGWAMWDVDSGKRLHEVDLPTLGGTYPNGLALTGPGDRMAIGFDQGLLVYSLENFERTSFSGIDATKAVAFRPMTPYLAAVNIRGRITMWDSITQRQQAVLQQPQTGSSNEDVAFSHDSVYFASSNADSIYLWDLTKAAEKMVLNGHDGAVPCVAFHPDGGVLASGGKDNALRFWDSITGAPLGSVNLGKAGQAISFSPEGRILAVGCMGGSAAPPLQLFDAATREVLHQLDPKIGDIHSLGWAQGGQSKYLAACGVDGVVLWKVSEKRPLSISEVMRQNRHWCLSTALNKSGTILVWSQNDWDLAAWKVDENREMPIHAPSMFSGWHGLGFLSDGQSIAYVSKAGQLEIWNVTEDRHVATLGAPRMFNAEHLAVSRDGRWLAALAQPDAVCIWHLPSGKQVFSFRPETGNVWSLAWDATSQHLAVGQSDGGLAVWHLPVIQKKLAEAGLEWREP